MNTRIQCHTRHRPTPFVSTATLAVIATVSATQISVAAPPGHTSKSHANSTVGLKHESPNTDQHAQKVAQRTNGIARTQDVSSSAEAAHRTQMDRAIAAIVNQPLAAADAKALFDAIKALREKKVDAALAIARTISNPTAKKIVTWYQLRTGQAEISDYRPFMQANPNWPNIWLIKEKFERAVFDENDHNITRKHFANYSPETAPGMAAHALERQTAGDTKRAKEIASKAWRDMDFPNDIKKTLTKNLGKLVTKADRAERKKRMSEGSRWSTRRRQAYEALDKKNPKHAYALVKGAGSLSVNPFNQQQFIAGWIALRYLKDPHTAIGHFKAMLKHSDGPLSRSKSAYWLARAHEAAGDADSAATYYKKATADQFDTYHALLARLEIAPGLRRLAIDPPDLPTQSQINAFNKNEISAAAVISNRAKLGPTVQRQFVVRLSKSLESEGEVAMAAHLSQALGDTQQALRIGKVAIADGMKLHYYAYPLHAFPDYKPLREPAETAFLLGIARQESEFNTLTLSHAGARGILQVMPVTAKHVCRDYKIKCNIKRLMTDESYNTMIASAYTADRMGEFDGSYVLGLAGYNAGPGRARQWIKRFGDPRDGRIDPIDWIERLPYQETRQYVAKVLSNIQMYRARLGDTQNALRLDTDLARAQKPVPNGKKLIAPLARH